MRRREFVARLSGSLLAWPIATLAQRPGMPLIGFLHQTSPEPALLAAFHRGLKEAGYVETRNVLIDHQWARGDYRRLSALADEIVSRNAAVMVAMYLPAALAAKAATKATSIVFLSGTDPVESGLVSSLSRPGGNITGVSMLTNPLIAKRLELVHQLVPKATAIAVLINRANPNSEIQAKTLQGAAQNFGLKLRFENASTDGELDAVFATFIQQHVSALLVSADSFFSSRRDRVVALAAHHRLPTIYTSRSFPEVGGLISYGPSYTDAYRLAGAYVGRILNGEKPADLPVQQSTKFELVINQKAAKAVALTVPNELLLRADEVIE
jgi:putative tryptophan/tyrosine transport system substrate-binding protein